MDGGDGFATFSPSFLARQGKSLEDNAYILSVRFFGKQVTVIIDCFEMFDRPTNLLARAQSFSNYMHHNTIKILIGITPQGSVCFVSQAWGGCTSDKYLTELWVFRTPSSWWHGHG